MSTFSDWYEAGKAAGYCGPIVCNTHDGTPTTAAEDEAFEDGDDPCVPTIRPYGDADERAAVEANHSPTVWRASNEKHHSNPAAGLSGNSENS